MYTTIFAEFTRNPATCISGSSVATAVAAGTASLALSCQRLADYYRNQDSGSDETSESLLDPVSVIRRSFKLMLTPNDEKYCMPSRLFKSSFGNTRDFYNPHNENF